MNDFTRSGETTELIRMVNVLNEKLNDSSKLLSKWQIEVDVEVETSTLDIKLTARKPFGGGGIIKTISKETALYYKDDIPSLTRELVNEIVGVLLEKEIYNEIHDKLFKAVRNISMIEAKR